MSETTTMVEVFAGSEKRLADISCERTNVPVPGENGSPCPDLRSIISRIRFNALANRLSLVFSRFILRMNSNGSFPVNFRYPEARREDVVDDFHGHKIADPYRHLEDPDGAETKDFVERLNAVSAPFLQDCKWRTNIKERLTLLWDYPKKSCLQKEGNHYFYYFNTGLQNQSVFFIQEKPEIDGSVFIDPNKLSDDGTTAMSTTSFTHDGTLLAYGLCEKGSDWTSVKFKKVPSGEDLPDKLEGLRYSSLAWTRDNRGVFYNMFPSQKTNNVGTDATKNEFHTLYYHELGTPQSDDIVCYDFPDRPEFMIGAQVTDDGRYLICSVDKGCDPTNMLFHYELTDRNGIKGRLDMKPIISQFESKYDFICNDGPIFTIMTDHEAPLFKLIRIDATKPEKNNWKTLVSEDKDAKLDWACLVATDKLVLCYIKDVKHVLYVHDAKTGERIRTIPLEIGTVAAFVGKSYLTEVFFKYQSFLTPGVIYRYDLADPDKEPEEIWRTEVKGIENSKFDTRQVFYDSKDGTRVPMYIVHRKDMQLNGENPCILYGYGGFNVPIMPSFSVSRSMFRQHFGGVYAVANIRGGSEYGEKWHQAAMKEKKQNVFDDFISAAEYLIANKYTRRDKLSIEGGSNGGLLVAACANQRPDVFGCVVNQVGVLDMLRFQNFTIGQAWIPEFGTSANSNDFDHLIKYSPLHNLKLPTDGYPAMLLLTGDHDDRVVPMHSLKYIAQLYHLINQEAGKQKKPILIRVDTKAGHGAGKPTSKLIDELTDIYCFLCRVLDLQWSNE